MFGVNFGLPRVLEQISTPQLERTLVMMKEHKKKMRRHGSFLQHYHDRDMFYWLMQGPKGSRYIVQPISDRRHYTHHMDKYGKYEVRSIKVRNSQYDQIGGVYRQRWDQNLSSSNPIFDGALKWQWKGVEKNNAIALFERWGVKAVVMDEYRRPTLGDRQYFKHRLYVHNFPWIREPDTNRDKGDADWNWKEGDHIGYEDYGGGTKDPRNGFTSIWRDTVAKYGEGGAAPAAAKPATTPAAAKPAAASAAEKPKPAAAAPKSSEAPPKSSDTSKKS